MSAPEPDKSRPARGRRAARPALAAAPRREGTPADQPLSLGAALDFMRGLWQLNHALERLSSKMEGELAVSAQQHWIIRCVGKYPGLTAGQLALQLHLDPGTVSAALGRLEQKELLERRRDPRDRRRVVLGLTRRGRALCAASTLERAVEQLLSAADPREVAATLNVLSGLSERLAAGAVADGGRPRYKRRS